MKAWLESRGRSEEGQTLGHTIFFLGYYHRLSWHSTVGEWTVAHVRWFARLGMRDHLVDKESSMDKVGSAVDFRSKLEICR